MFIIIKNKWVFWVTSKVWSINWIFSIRLNCSDIGRNPNIVHYSEVYSQLVWSCYCWSPSTIKYSTPSKKLSSSLAYQPPAMMTLNLLRYLQCLVTLSCLESKSGIIILPQIQDILMLHCSMPISIPVSTMIRYRIIFLFSLVLKNIGRSIPVLFKNMTDST